ncbi:hypothetical protein GTW37_25095, partial [Streptomyces sp. SID4931]
MSSGARSRRPATPLPARVFLAARVTLAARVAPAVAAFGVVVALLLTTACEAPGRTATDDRAPAPP